MVLKYAYTTLIRFSQLVSSHNFMIRCVPYRTDNQKVIRAATTVIPSCPLTESVDAFGNVVQSGYVADHHDVFMFEAAGIVDVSGHVYREPLNRIFLYPTSLTRPSEGIVKLADDAAKMVDNQTNRTANYVENLSRTLQNRFVYRAGITTVTTTASDALRMGKGVCQDYAHIAIAACRLQGIAARYVCGFMIGEGATHAWIEVHDGKFWRAFDPTNDRWVDDTYIKIACGRDFDDCSVNRGRFCGAAAQDVSVKLKVERCRRPNF